MRVLITGATGFIGRALCKDLCKDYEVIALSRDVRRALPLIGDYAKIFEWDGRSTGTWISQADGAFAIINLAPSLIWRVTISHRGNGTDIKRRGYFTAGSMPSER